MGRKVERLSAKKVDKDLAPGYYADGANLYLQVSAARTKSWIFRYTLAGRSREMGLGPARDIGLADARERAAAARRLLLDGVDPIEHRAAQKAQTRLEAASALTFAECAKRYIAAHRAGWSNPKHAAQWENTLDTYAGKILGPLPVAAVDTGLVVRVLEPIWTTKRETAGRVRGRIEKILDWARVRGYRTGDNPARWRGHLDHLLPKGRQAPKHLEALPYTEVGAFMAQLRQQAGAAARALELTILTAARTEATRGARPEEFDLERATWTVPAERMKGNKGRKKEHRIPLSPRAVQLVKEQLAAIGGAPFLFPSPANQQQSLSNGAMLMLLERMKRGDVTVHGFRSTFRDWSAECTNYANEICEMALAHAIGDKTEEAYRRGDLFEKRARLMVDWARYCEKPERGKVTPIRKSA